MSDTPATFTLLIGLFAFFAVIRVKRWTGDTVGASAESIEGRQYWRLLTSNCAHVDATHFVGPGLVARGAVPVAPGRDAAP